MVGFGSSLRMARRSGWEGAYLDYETLKLLLSQIEAVYEEEGHRQHHRTNVFLHDDEVNPNTTNNDGNGNPRSKRKDFRVDLFLESDSDAAYASVEEEERQPLSPVSSPEDLEQQQVLHRSGGGTTQAKPFTLSYSHEATSSEEGSMEGGCGVGVTQSLSSWATWDKNAVSADKMDAEPKDSKKKPKKRRVSPTLEDDDDNFYVKPFNHAATDTFFLAGNEESSQSESQSNSILNAPMRTWANESASLLPPGTPSHPVSALYSFQASNGSITPPRGVPAIFENDFNAYEGHMSSSGGPPMLPSLDKHHVAERKRDRLVRRRKRKDLKAKRRQRERKVPRYIRVAHSKARAITERFLGLLRAETEKVMLFAQARLGELADTAGSLRFPSFDDGDYGNKSRSGSDKRGAGSYEYPLSDGGRHPSASSSDDDGAGGRGQFPWSDSSDEDSRVSEQLPKLPNVYSMGGLSDDTDGRTNRTRRGTTHLKMDLKRTSNPEIKDSETLKAVQRQIAHFADLRNDRPVFQRNEQILNEDMLLLSAVEEADGFTAVAVELMHVLRFICVNLIAVRKICRKHDRLLMNRMLGGYYHRTKTRGAGGDYSHFEDAKTLGGLVARVSGDIYEAHPALIGQMNHFKLVGVYDKKIQKMANSRTVQVISSCLALALAESEVTQSRADALTNLNSTSSLKTPKRSGNAFASRSPESAARAFFRTPGTLESDDEGDEGLPSTASSVSLTRLRFSVTSIFALREAARYKVDLYGTYLSRSVLAFTGQPVVGEGLDGCSRESLDFIVAYNPDAALLLDCDVLFDGLQRGHWMRVPVGDLMISALAAALTPGSVQSDVAPRIFTSEELAVSNAVSVVPESKNMALSFLLKGRLRNTWTERSSLAISEAPLVALRLNRMTYFLFTMNYFVFHATTSAYVKATGLNPAHSATVIGVPCLSAIFVALFHCWLLSRESASYKFSTALFRYLFLFSASMGVLGNIFHAHGIDTGSIRYAILGRFLFGFSSAEILHRQLLATCLPSHIVAEAALLVRSRIAGLVCGLLVGSVAEIIPIRIERLGARAFQSSSWLMAILWGVHFVRIIFRFRAKGSASDSEKGAGDGQLTVEQVEALEAAPETDYDSSVSSASDQDGESKGLLSNSLSRESITANYGTSSATIMLPSQGNMSTEASPVQRMPSIDSRRRAGFRQVKTFTSRIRKLLAYHIGIPVALALMFYVNFTLEIMFTSSPFITWQYFGWSGAHSSLLLGCLAACILPVDFVCEQISRRYEERTVMKRSIAIIALGLLVMVNWLSIASLATRLPILLVESNGRHTHPYDWRVGLVQYFCGMTTTFAGLVALEGATLSLLSKVSPPRLRSVVINVGTIVTFLGFTARLLGDAHILTVGLSHRLINMDIINSLLVPLFLAALVAVYFLKRHFFFLI